MTIYTRYMSIVVMGFFQQNYFLLYASNIMFSISSRKNKEERFTVQRAEIFLLPDICFRDLFVILTLDILFVLDTKGFSFHYFVQIAYSLIEEQEGKKRSCDAYISFVGLLADPRYCGTFYT